MNEYYEYLRESNCHSAEGSINTSGTGHGWEDLLAGYNSYKRVKAGIAANTDAYEGGLFDGYVSGVFDSAVGIVLCVSGDVKNGQIQEVVGQFLETHPASRQRLAVLLATQALMQAFPCK